MNTTPIIDVKNFNLYYGENHALHNINMHINEHEITALIGPSGCGKSTFLRSLNRMNDLIEGLRVDGSIKFKGTELVNTKINVSALRKDIGMVFQSQIHLLCLSTITSHMVQEFMVLEINQL